MENSAVINSKLEHCKEELKALLRKLSEGYYDITAEFVYDHIANSGVEMKINKDLVDSKSMKEFLEEN